MAAVTLYIPCFNAEETIGFCLKGVFKQAYPLKEVLVIDDGSTDKSIEIACRFPVRIISHGCNKGLAAARNTAINLADTEFIASLDADCVPESDWLSRLMERLVSPETAGVGGRLLESNPSVSIFDLWRSVHMRQSWGEEDNTAPPFLFGSNTVFRREALINIGLYNENYRSNYEDVDVSERLKKAGYALFYESKAIVHHLKSDNINSLLNSFWKWNLAYYQNKRFYAGEDNFILKIKDNLGLANRYIEEDAASGRHQLLYLDFLLALHHSLRDFEYFIGQNNPENPERGAVSALHLWLAMLDLTFFYHFNSGREDLPTLIPKTNAFLQNFFALNLILGRFIRERFNDYNFIERLYRHLLPSVYKTDDVYLSERLLNLIELHDDWSGLCNRKQFNLNITFLKLLSSSFQNWFANLTRRLPEIIRMIEVSSEGIDSQTIVKKERGDGENG